MNERAGGGGRRIRGVAVGVVTNISDPQQWGRVKVRLPWLDGPDAAIESHWARVAGWYAGNSRGTMFVPEIGDEVLVAFEGGDPNHPYVLGAVWNGEHAVPGPGNPDGANDHKWFRSRAGHDLEFLDSDGAEKIRLVDSSTNNSMVFDTAADTITTEAKTGTINIRAPKGLVKIVCVDLTMTTSQGRTLEVGTTHTVTVGSARTVNVSAGNFIELAGSAMTITAPQLATTTKSDVGVSAGAMVMNQGQISTEIGEWGEVQQGPVVRTVGSQTVQTDGFMTVNMAGELSGTFTLLAGSAMSSAKGGFLFNGGPVTVMGGLVNAKAGSMVVAKDASGGKAALSAWLGGLLLLNPNALTFPATKLLDPIMGLDFHTTLPAPLVPPLPPIPLFPTPFMGPILIDFKATVLINFMPAAGAGATALGFHMPPLPWLWPPISHRPMITAAIMALMTAPFNAMLEMARGKVLALASASGNPVFQRGFVADFVGSSHANVNAGSVTSAGKTYSVSASGQGQFAFTRIFPMFSSGQAFLGFLASLLPLPIANASVSIASPTVSVCDAPLGLMIPLGCNSCSDIPVVPNAMAMGFSNVLTGMSIGDFLGALAWGMVQGAATAGFQAGLRRGGNAVARRISNSNSPRLQNAAQRVNDFVGGNNCIAEGHPVDVVSGTVFTEATDFELFSARTLRFGRFYNSRATELPGDASQLGPGWRHDFDEVLLADEDTTGVRTLALRDREGRFIGFDLPLVDGESDFNAAERLTLTRVDGRTYEIRDLADRVRVFRFGGGDGPTPPTYQPPAGKQAHLDAVRWLDGEARFHWEKGRLTGFTDAAGRQVVVQPDPQGRIAGLRLVRAQGRDCDIHLATYRYDGDGRLIAHIDRNRNPRWYRYDKAGRLIRETDRNGYSFHFHYDELDRCTHTYGDDNAYWCAFAYDGSVTRVTDGFGGVTRYGYDEDSRVTSIIDALGGVTTRAYTEAGWLASVTDAAGSTWSLAYDARGAVTTHVDANGHATALDRDAAGRLVGAVDPLGHRWHIGRDAAGRVVERRFPRGGRQQLERDADGRPTALVTPDGRRFERVWGPDGVREDRTPDGRRLRYQHDATGRVEAVDEIAADGEVRTHRYQRDAEGRVVGVDGPGGTRLRYTLLPEGQPTLIEQDGRKAQRRYDAGGALIEHVDPLGRAARVTVDLHRQPTEVSLPGGLRWRFTRDRLGHVTRMEAPDGSITRYTRDAVGRPVAEDRAGEVVERRFDACGQVTRLKDAAGGELRLSYDALGRLVRAEADDDAPVERRYDSDGNLAAEVQGEAVLRWRYDALGHALGRRTSWGGRVDYLWGAAGVDSLVDPAGETHRFDRDVRGRRVAWERPGGGVERDVFSPGGHLERTWLEIPGQPAAADRRLFWSPEGTITGLHEAEDDRSTRHEYRYDGLGRLVGERRNDGPWRPYVHDDRDNLVDDPAQGSRTFDGVRLVQAGEDVVRHDRRARREAVTHGDGTRTTWWYDRRGRLARVHTRDDRIVHHRYDALGRRVETVAEVAGGVRREALVWDGDQLARRVVTTAAGQREEEYVYDPQRQLPLLRVVRAGGEVTSQYYQVDQRGAAIRLTDAAGQQLWRGRYEPYGGCAEEGPEAGEQPLRLAGQVEDAATGLCHHRHRVYDPDRRSFLTADPLGLDAGLNPFAFPSDPVQFADPLGLARCGQGELMLGSELTEPIYFGQARIAGRFADIGSPAPDSIRGRPIEAVAADLRAGRIAGEDLPVQVFRDPTTGRLTAINNRGLAAWSLAGRNPDLVILTTPTAAETNRLREPSLVRGDSLPSPHTAVTPGKNDTSIIGIVSTPGNATPPGYPAYPSE